MKRASRARELQVAIVASVALLAQACGSLVDNDEASGVRADMSGAVGPASSSESGEFTVGDVVGDDLLTSEGPGDGSASSSGVVSEAGSGGGGSASPDAAGAAAGVSDPGVTDSEIRVGCSATLSGFAAFSGEETVGPVDSWFQHINAAGGINGRKLRLICYDDGGDASRRLANVRKLYEQDKVVVMLPGNSTGLEDYLTRNKIPSLEIGAAPAAFRSKYPTIIPIAEHPFEFTGQLTQALQDTGVFKQGMKVAILYDPGYSRYVEIFRDQWEHAGAEVVTEDPIALTDDCTSLVLKMRQLDIDYWDFEGAGWVACATASQRQNYRPNIGWGNWPSSVRLLIEQVGPYTEGMWSGTFADQIDGKPRQKTKAHEDMLEIISKYHPRIAEPGSIDSPITQSSWIIAHLLTDAFEAQGDAITKQGLLEWLWAVENYDTGISTPIISLAPDCKAGTGTSWFGRWHWKDNRAEIVPETGYLYNPNAERYGGKCHMTMVVDKQEGG